MSIAEQLIERGEQRGLAKGTLLGAVGVSGAPKGNLDDECGNAGIKAVQDSLELE